MPVYSRKEFAEKCGIKPSALETYISRGNVVSRKDKMIDDSEPANADFLKKKLEKIRSKLEGADEAQTMTMPLPPPPDHPGTEPTGGIKTKYELEKDKRKLEIEKLEEEIEKLKLHNQKQRGDTIPTELVMTVFAMHFKSMTSAFKNAMDKQLTRWAKAKDFSREEIAAARGHIIQDINEAVTDGIRESKKSIKLIISQTSVKKEVGER